MHNNKICLFESVRQIILLDIVTFTKVALKTTIRLKV